MKNLLIQSLSFEVQSQKLQTLDGLTLPDHQCLRRSDDNGILNVCKNSYTPFYNHQFTDLVNEVSRVSNMPLEGYQEFDGGKKVIAYLINENQTKLLDYEVKDYLVIANSHDSSTKLFITSTSEMIRCQNRWSRLQRQARALSVQHSAKSIAQAVNFPREIEIFNNLKIRENTMFQAFEKVKIDNGILDSLVTRLLDLDKKMDGREKLSTRASKIKESLMDSIERETKDLGNNLFGFFHGVTHYTTHIRKEKEESFGLFGTNKILNDKAIELALELV